MHGSRGGSAQVERSIEEKAEGETAEIEGKTAVSEAEGRKQESDERLAVPQVKSVEALRFKSVRNAYAETGKQDDGAIEMGESGYGR